MNGGGDFPLDRDCPPDCLVPLAKINYYPAGQNSEYRFNIDLQGR